MKSILFLFLGCTVFYMSCQSGNKGNTNNGDSLMVEETDPTVDNSAIVGEALHDPDTTDTIPANAYHQNSFREEAVATVRKTLQEAYKMDLTKELLDTGSRKFTLLEVDLNNDQKKEIFVGLTGPYFCGSGGCTILLLQNDGSQLSRFTVTGYPIIIDANKTNEWSDLILSSNGQFHTVKFDGKRYPSNPSVQPIYQGKPSDKLERALDIEQEAYPRFQF